MKKFSVILIASVLVLSGCSSSKKETLRILSPTVYIDKSVITDFEKEHNVKVIYDTFDSNEAMYTKILSGDKYDILIPSDYMIERLIEEDKLEKLDRSKLKNIGGLNPELLGKSFDPSDEYSVPYFWGSIGIVYNQTVIDKTLVETQGWSILRNTDYKGRLYFYDSERDAFMIALKALGYSANTTSVAELEAAQQWLLDQKAEMNPIYVTDEVIDYMLDGTRDLAILYSGDAAYVMSENEDMAYFEPLEGTNVWVDSLVITKDVTNIDLALAWIDFMLDPEVAEKNAVEVGYTPVILSVYQALSGPGGDFEGISAFTPRSGYSKDEIFRHNEAMRVKIAELWNIVIAK